MALRRCGRVGGFFCLLVSLYPASLWLAKLPTLYALHKRAEHLGDNLR